MRSRHFSIFTLAAVFILALAGCATLETAPKRQTGSDDPLTPADEEVIGIITSVDPAEEIALIEMRSPGTQTAELLLTRNVNLTETSRLEPTRFRRGRILGAKILSGLPNVGDEVLMP